MFKIMWLVKAKRDLVHISEFFEPEATRIDSVEDQTSVRKFEAHPSQGWILSNIITAP